MVLDNSMGIYIDVVENQQRSRVVSSIGTREDLYYSAVGKALLAFLAEKKLKVLLK